MGWREKAIKAAARGLEEYNKASGKIDVVKDVVAGGAKIASDIASEKVQEIKEANAKKPSTGSGLLDALLPAVPTTEVTKPKAEKKTPPKPQA